MNKKFVCFGLIWLAVSSSLLALKSDSPFGQQEEAKIFINNRILARVNAKIISTFDLMKKMDFNFYKYYPQYTSSIAARYQYYQMNWKYVLEEMIDKELVLADAGENKIKVTSGDVRQEMEASFGPNIIDNLDSAGLTFEEASKILEEEMIMRRTIGGRVHVKAVRLVTPAKVRQAYELFIQDPNNAQMTQWIYRVLTVKDPNEQKGEKAAKSAYDLLMEGVPLEELTHQLKERKLIGRKTKVTLSNEVRSHEQELSKTYQEVLSLLDTGMYSQPFSSKSRSTNVPLYRILFIKEKIPGRLPSFKELEASLKDQLLNEEIDRLTETYLKKLRQHYHILEADLVASLPADYEPFVLDSPGEGHVPAK